jgi:hypothetical protein
MAHDCQESNGLEAKMHRIGQSGRVSLDELVQFCQEHNIRLEYMTPYIIEQNGIAEQMNCTI